MYKIIGGDQREYGPVSAEEVRRWINEGRLNAQSRAQLEGAGEWKLLSDFPEFAQALGTVAQEGNAAGVETPPLIDTSAWTAQVLAREPQLEIGRCLESSWRLLIANFGLLFGASAVIWLVGFAQFIPVIGLAYKILVGVFYGGLYLVFLKRIRGQSAEIKEVFVGFNLSFGQLLLAGFLSALLSGIGMWFCLIPGIYLAVAWVFSVPLVADKRLEFWPAMELSRKVVTRVWFPMLGLLLLSFLPMIIVGIFSGVKLGTSISATVHDLVGGSPPDPARLIETIMRVAKSSLVFSFISRAVLLFNMPFAVGALMYAYESLFGSRRPATP